MKMKLEINKNHISGQTNCINNAKKRISAGVMGVVVAVSLFSGCSLNNQFSNNNDNMPQSVSETANKEYLMNVYDYSESVNRPVNNITVASSQAGLEIYKQDWNLTREDLEVLNSKMDYTIPIDEFASKRNLDADVVLKFCQVKEIPVSDVSDRINGLDTLLLRHYQEYNIGIDEYVSKTNYSIDEVIGELENIGLSITDKSQPINGVYLEIVENNLDIKNEKTR